MSSHYFSHDAYLQPGSGGGAAGLHSLDVTRAVSSNHEAPADGVSDHLGAAEGADFVVVSVSVSDCLDSL